MPYVPHEVDECGLESRREVAGVGPRHLEVERQRAGGDTDSHSSREARREPRDLLGDQRDGPEQHEERAGRGPTVRHRVEREAGRLQRVREVTAEAAVMLARHDAVEPALACERGLRTELVDDRGGRQFEVRVQA